MAWVCENACALNVWFNTKVFITKKSYLSTKLNWKPRWMWERGSWDSFKIYTQSQWDSITGIKTIISVFEYLFYLLHPNLCSFCFHFLQFVSFFSPFALCLALIYMIQTSIAFLGKKKTLPSLAFDHSSAALITFVEVCTHPSGPDRMSRHMTTACRIICKQSLKRCSFSIQLLWTISDSAGIFYCALTSVVRALSGYSHIGTDATISSPYIHISCKVYRVTHNSFTSQLYERSLTARSAKICIWIWALRWLMKPSRHWKWVAHSPAAEEKPYYSISAL